MVVNHECVERYLEINRKLFTSFDKNEQSSLIQCCVSLNHLSISRIHAVQGAWGEGEEVTSIQTYSNCCHPPAEDCW